MKSFIAALFLLLASYASAAIMPATSSGNVTTYGAGTMSAADLATAAISRASDSSLQVQKSIDLVVEGRAAAVQGISKPLPVNYAKAVGNFARGIGGAALKTAGWVYAGIEAGKALNDLCNELGYSCYKGTSPAGSDTVVISKQSSMATCNVTYVASPYSPTTEFIHTKYCVPSYAGSPTYNYGWSISWGGAGWPGVSFPCGNYTCKTGSGEYALGQTTNASSDPVPSTIEELEASIAAKSGWPSGSALPKVVEQAIASGETLSLPAPTQITGPSSIPGPTSTETKPAQNGQPAETKTTSTTYNISYGPNTVTTNQTTTTVINNGDTITTTTEETEPEAAPSDTPNPDLPKLYTRKYPDGLTGVWTERKAELLATPLPNLIQSFTPTITSGSACPQFSIPLNIGPWHWGTYSLGPACYVWDFLKVCVILGAIFLARAVVFGG